MVTVAQRPIGRIAYFFEYPIRRGDLGRFGIELMRGDGIAVSIFDVGEMTQPNIPQDRSHYGRLADLDLHVVRNAADLAKAEPRLGAVELIVAAIGTAGLTRSNIPVFRAITRTGRPYMMVFANAFPGWNKFRGERGVLWKRLAHVWARVGEIDWLNSVIARLPPSLFRIRPADYVVLGGNKSALPHRLVAARTRPIYAHSMDYERLRSLPLPAQKPRPFAVFIDEYLPYHPDILVLNTTSPMSPEAYFGALRAFFDRIEQAVGLEVVIAANPRANYADKPGLFGRRKIVENDTHRLIRDSALVIAHRSTAIGLAVIARRPVMLAATQEIYRHSAHRAVFDALSTALNQPIVFFDDPENMDLSSVFSFDESAYARYMADYVKAPGSPDEPLWRIVLDAVSIGATVALEPRAA